VHSADSTGNFDNADIWNTNGGDTQFNVYVAPGALPGGSFLNSGNGSGVSLNIPLPPGVYTFSLFGEPGVVRPFFAINIFFNGVSANPGISALVPVDGSSFTPNAGANTISLTFDPFNVFFVPGANTVIFNDGSTAVTLTAFSWFQPSAVSINRVQGFNESPGGSADFVGEITLTVVALATPVNIDIKPGSFPNSINLNSAGVVPVAILSSLTFDATQVDPTTVTLAGARVRLIGKGDRYSCAVEDVNADGLPDLVCHVVTAQFIIEPGDSVAVLEAETFGGVTIRGEDSIQIVP
jgi:hypothetical protein